MTAKREITERRDPIQEFADRIIAELEKGVKPWIRPWDPDKAGGPQAPFNPVTKHTYRGINVLILGISLLAFQTGDPRWCSFLQAKEKGWHVKKGSKATTIFFTRNLVVKDAKDGGDDADEDGKTIRMLRHYPVFHASQLENIPSYEPPGVEEAPWRRPEGADIILRNSGAVVRIGGEKAFYSPSTDHIQLPPEHAFTGPQAWAATTLHEAIHWSGAKHRLDRDLSGRFKSKCYSFEELVAEIGSAFLAMNLNIPSELSNHVSYIADWLSILKDDKKAIFSAAALAQKAADYLLNFHPEYAAYSEVQTHSISEELSKRPPHSTQIESCEQCDLR
jgi:antirestriction protein ArdC